MRYLTYRWVLPLSILTYMRDRAFLQTKQLTVSMGQNTEISVCWVGGLEEHLRWRLLPKMQPMGVIIYTFTQLDR